MKYGFGVDLGGTTVKIAYFDEKGNLLDKWESMTGQPPAYKIMAEQDAVEKAHQSQQQREPQRKSQQREAPQEKRSFKMKM